MLYAAKRDREGQKAAADLIRELRESLRESAADGDGRRQRPAERHRADRPRASPEHQQEHSARIRR